jgi:hypothetical protein
MYWQNVTFVLDMYNICIGQYNKYQIFDIFSNVVSQKPRFYSGTRAPPPRWYRGIYRYLGGYIGVSGGQLGSVRICGGLWTYMGYMEGLYGCMVVCVVIGGIRGL